MGSVWDLCGVVLGLFGDRFGIVFGSIWDRVGFVSGSVWERFGIVLELFWDRLGVDLGSFEDLFWEMERTSLGKTICLSVSSPMGPLRLLGGKTVSYGNTRMLLPEIQEPTSHQIIMK